MKSNLYNHAVNKHKVTTYPKEDTLIKQIKKTNFVVNTRIQLGIDNWKLVYIFHTQQINDYDD